MVIGARCCKFCHKPPARDEKKGQDHITKSNRSFFVSFKFVGYENLFVVKGFCVRIRCLVLRQSLKWAKVTSRSQRKPIPNGFTYENDFFKRKIQHEINVFLKHTLGTVLIELFQISHLHFWLIQCELVEDRYANFERFWRILHAKETSSAFCLGIPVHPSVCTLI